MNRKRALSLAALAFIAVGALTAQAASQPAPPKTILLQPKKMAGVEQGEAVVVKGEAGPTPQRFSLEKLSYMRPIAVALRPVNQGDEVALKVTKYAWNAPLREGKTSGDILRYVFRTEGEFQVSIDAPKPGTPYRLLVWIGDETKPQFTPVVVKASEYQGDKDSGGFAGSPVMWVIAGALLAIVALLAVLVLRRKRA